MSTITDLITLEPTHHIEARIGDTWRPLTESVADCYDATMEYRAIPMATPITDLSDLIAAALLDPAAYRNSITIYWDEQDKSNQGPAYRVAGGESGALELLMWEGDAKGMHLEDFFRHNGAYSGPDADGVYPVLIA